MAGCLARHAEVEQRGREGDGEGLREVVAVDGWVAEIDEESAEDGRAGEKVGLRGEVAGFEAIRDEGERECGGEPGDDGPACGHGNPEGEREGERGEVRRDVERGVVEVFGEERGPAARAEFRVEPEDGGRAEECDDGAVVRGAGHVAESLVERGQGLDCEDLERRDEAGEKAEAAEDRLGHADAGEEEEFLLREATGSTRVRR